MNVRETMAKYSTQDAIHSIVVVQANYRYYRNYPGPGYVYLGEISDMTTEFLEEEEFDKIGGPYGIVNVYGDCVVEYEEILDEESYLGYFPEDDSYLYRDGVKLVDSFFEDAYGDKDARVLLLVLADDGYRKDRMSKEIHRKVYDAVYKQASGEYIAAADYYSFRGEFRSLFGEIMKTTPLAQLEEWDELGDDILIEELASLCMTRIKETYPKL